MPVSLPLRTARLLLEPMTPADAEGFAAYRSDPDVARLQSWDAPYPIERALAALRGNPERWPVPGEWLQIALRAGGVLVGDVAVHPLDDPAQPGTVELGVTLAAAHQGRGYAAEALAAVIDACLAADVRRLTASTDARNEPVARLLARLGFRHEGRLVDAERWKGEWTTIDLWALLPRDRALPVSAKAVVRIGDAVLLGENDRGEWELLGGRPEPGETLEEAVAREVLEEASLRVVVGDRVLDEPFEVLPGGAVRIVAFRCDLGDEAGYPRGSAEHRRIAFFPIDGLDGVALPPVYRRAIAAAVITA